MAEQESKEELKQGLIEGIKRGRAAKASDAAKAHGTDSDEAWQAFTGEDSK